MTGTTGHWELGIAVTGRGDVAGASRLEGQRPWRVDGDSIGAIVAEAARKHGRGEPEQVVVVHPRWMDHDELAGVIADLGSAGIPEWLIRSKTDADVLVHAKAASPGETSRDRLNPGALEEMVIVDAASERVYGRAGWASPVGADVVDEVAARVRTHGAFATEVVLVGPHRTTREIRDRLSDVVAEPVRYSLLDLACGGLMPESIRTEPIRAEHIRSARDPRATAAVKREAGGDLLRKLLVRVMLLGTTAALAFFGWTAYSAKDRHFAWEDNADGSKRLVVHEADKGAIVPSPAMAPAGSTVPQKMAHHFRPFDPADLAERLGGCSNAGGADFVELDMACAGEGRAFNEWARDNGLPAVWEDGASAALRFTTLHDPTTWPELGCESGYRYEALPTNDRTWATLYERCNDVDEPYAGAYPASEPAELLIHDRRHAVVVDGGLEYPVLILVGLADRDAGAALVNALGLGPA